MKSANEINQWMTPKQITELDGMPGTIQGVHKRAKKEGWPKRSQEGRRGPGVEYIPAIPAMQKIAIEEMNADTLKMFSLLINKLGENEVREIELNMAKYGLSGLMQERPPSPLTPYWQRWVLIAKHYKQLWRCINYLQKLAKRFCQCMVFINRKSL